MITEIFLKLIAKISDMIDSKKIYKIKDNSSLEKNVSNVTIEYLKDHKYYKIPSSDELLIGTVYNKYNDNISTSYIMDTYVVSPDRYNEVVDDIILNIQSPENQYYDTKKIIKQLKRWRRLAIHDINYVYSRDYLIHTLNPDQSYCMLCTKAINIYKAILKNYCKNIIFRSHIYKLILRFKS